MCRIRQAFIEDIPAITEIYNEAILTTTATFDTEPKSIEQQQQWFIDHEAQYPVLVAEKEGCVIGWASLSRWSDRCAYRETAEVSLYVHAGERGKGTGKKLFEAIMQMGKEAGLHTVIARIVAGNIPSIHLCESAGFIHIGSMKEIGRKFGKLLDVELMQKIY